MKLRYAVMALCVIVLLGIASTPDYVVALEQENDALRAKVAALTAERVRADACTESGLGAAHLMIARGEWRKTRSTQGGRRFRSRAATNDGPTVVPSEGMTLRDYFAGKAMQGICAHLETWRLVDTEIAARAYVMADAMLKAREVSQ